MQQGGHLLSGLYPWDSQTEISKKKNFTSAYFTPPIAISSIPSILQYPNNILAHISLLLLLLLIIIISNALIPGGYSPL